jgi:hypothetical protein
MAHEDKMSLGKTLLACVACSGTLLGPLGAFALAETPGVFVVPKDELIALKGFFASAAGVSLSRIAG